MISLAMDLAEKQIRAGTASSQIVTHFLKAGMVREELERDKLRRENALLAAKADQIASQAGMEELYKGAIAAMREYGGREAEDDFQ